MRLDISKLTPYANVTAETFGEYTWRATNDDPQFILEDSPLLAAKWLSLEVDLLFSGHANTPFTLYFDEGTGFSEAASIRLYADRNGKIRFAWKASPTLQVIRIDPIGQPGRFTLKNFSVTATAPPWLLAKAGGRILAAQGWKKAADVLSGTAQALQSGHWKLAAGALIQAYNAPALSASPSPPLSLAELAQNRRHDPGRLAVLEQYVAECLETANGKVATGARYVGKASDPLDAKQLPIKTIAFYLPQFHPIPENDLWWGKGFTDWTNVSKAQPQFLGHYQPRLPGELGFYDLRLPEVMRQQIELAKLYGIYGFCFHHYWFGGKRLLELPVNNLLADPTLDINFCLCWANENWSRRWDGSESDVLIAQAHSPEDDIAFFDALVPAFSDPRYIRIDGKPILIVYLASLLPNAAETAQRWRQRASQHGFPGIYLVAARSFHVTSPKPFDFDAAVEFPPHQIAGEEISYQCKIVNPNYQGKIFDYRAMAESYARIAGTDYVHFKTVMPSWDNAARKPGKGHTYHGSEPEIYAEWLANAANTTLQNRPEERLLFINAWNEWAEGAHLEPDRRYGYAYLQATAQILRNLG